MLMKEKTNTEVKIAFFLNIHVTYLIAFQVNYVYIFFFFVCLHKCRCDIQELGFRVERH